VHKTRRAAYVWSGSNPRAAKTQSPLKFARVRQTPEPISAVSEPKFTILWGHTEEVLLFNRFFFLIVDICLKSFCDVRGHGYSLLIYIDRRCDGDAIATSRSVEPAKCNARRCLVGAQPNQVRLTASRQTGSRGLFFVLSIEVQLATNINSLVIMTQCNIIWLCITNNRLSLSFY